MVQISWYRFGPQRTVDSVHRGCVSAHACVVHRAYQQPPRGRPVNSRGQSPVSCARFPEKPLYFIRINPQSNLIQNSYFSVLFLFG